MSLKGKEKQEVKKIIKLPVKIYTSRNINSIFIIQIFSSKHKLN